MSITSLANHYRTDKGTLHGVAHAYSCVYDVLLNGLRDKPINLMEVGLQVGGPETGESADRTVTEVPSVNVWLEYFPHAHVHGIDISDFSQFSNERFTFYRADCGNAADLDAVVRAAPDCDVIIDDASHASYHQQLTWLKLFPKVKPGGLYIIEDLGWQPAEYEDSLPGVPRTRDLIEGLLQKGSFVKTGAISEPEWCEVRDQIESVLLFDHRTLVRLGRLYNRVNGIEGHYPEVYDRVRAFSINHLKTVIVRGLELLLALFASTHPVRNPSVKLAVVQKKAHG